MEWTMTQAGQLLSLAEAGALDRAQLAAAGPLEPRRAAWLLAADRLFAFAGSLLLAAGLIFFFAYNWDDLHRFVRLGVAVAALAACVVAALAARPFGTTSRAALFGVCLATGAMLALVGQTYQTGADVWELFVAWAALMLPFAALSRSSASWALWLAVANTGILRALSTSAWFGFFAWLDGPDSFLIVAGWNLAVLAVFEFAGGWLLVAPTRAIQRLAALGVLVPLMLGACIAWWQESYLPLLAAFVLAAAVTLGIYLRLRRDLVILAMAAFASIAVVTAGVAKILGHNPGFLSWNLLALAVIVPSGLAAVWLTHLYREESAA